MTTLGVPRELAFEWGETVKIDNIDKKILTLLSNNGRMSIAAIADKIGLSRDGTKYRIDRLVAEHVIEGFAAIVNPSKIGLYLYVSVNLTLWNITPEREKELAEYLRKAPYIVYVCKTMGRSDMILEVFAKHAGHLDEILADLRAKFPDIIKEIEISTMIKEYKWAEFPGTLD